MNSRVVAPIPVDTMSGVRVPLEHASSTAPASVSAARRSPRPSPEQQRGGEQDRRRVRDTLTRDVLGLAVRREEHARPAARKAARGDDARPVAMGDERDERLGVRRGRDDDVERLRLERESRGSRPHLLELDEDDRVTRRLRLDERSPRRISTDRRDPSTTRAGDVESAARQRREPRSSPSGLSTVTAPRGAYTT